ncbi:uncharacterized protein [Triticum aestivum]|uniref:uncharacterized protein n=1 Tax=Triticum aestivum TaxID=4565 RepID=UPI001D029845|nr:uncharacterized protein LOC123166852 [Triticum aestivum]
MAGLHGHFPTPRRPASTATAPSPRRPVFMGGAPQRSPQRPRPRPSLTTRLRTSAPSSGDGDLAVPCPISRRIRTQASPASHLRSTAWRCAALAIQLVCVCVQSGDGQLRCRELVVGDLATVRCPTTCGFCSCGLCSLASAAVRSSDVCGLASRDFGCAAWPAL